MSDTEEMRTCRVCGEIRSMAGEKLERCLKCQGLYAAAYYAARKEGILARQTAYRAQPEARARRTAYLADYNAKPENKARRAALRARPETKARRAAYGAAYKALRGPNGRLEHREYAAMWKRQNGRCDICRRPFCDNLRPYKDHNHDTGVLRGLLCRSCNFGLGNFGDDLLRLRRAITYLRKSAVNGELPL